MSVTQKKKKKMGIWQNFLMDDFKLVGTFTLAGRASPQLCERRCCQTQVLLCQEAPLRGLQLRVLRSNTTSNTVLPLHSEANKTDETLQVIQKLEGKIERDMLLQRGS